MVRGVAKLWQLATSPAHHDVGPIAIKHIDVCLNSVSFDHGDDTEDAAFQQLGTAVMQIRDNIRDPSFYTRRPCLICGKPGHSFAECPSMTGNTPKTFEVCGKLVNLFDKDF